VEPSAPAATARALHLPPRHAREGRAPPGRQGLLALPGLRGLPLMPRRTPEVRLYLGASETFGQHRVLCLWAIAYPSGHVAHRAILRETFSHKRWGRSLTVPPKAINLQRTRPERTTRPRAAAARHEGGPINA
jgi:hypothetical protein